ncbi:MAG: DUF1318 domain-containing protein [Candidatus Omnitrophica bacterium]|nr:DUF1318 domain-containing protein [Candidatus Omnitrophota bacterium]
MKKIFVSMVLILAFCGVALAQGAYSIKEKTPAVQAALENRKARFPQLKALKAEGVLGENNRGYVEALGGGADAKSLAAAENTDRKFIYQTIVEQNNLDAGALSTVEGVFAGVQRDKASSGEKIQDAGGNWVTK